MDTVHGRPGVEDRRKIGRWRHARVSVEKMARVLGRHRSTIFRELQRQPLRRPGHAREVVGYFAMAAQLQMADRRTRQRKLVRHSALRECVVAGIKAGWTPERIAGRMRLDGARPRVCQETIYRHVHSREGMSDEPWWHLPTHRTHRRPRRARKRLPPKFGRGPNILFRPDAVAHRTQFGHREGDSRGPGGLRGPSGATVRPPSNRGSASPTSPPRSNMSAASR